MTRLLFSIIIISLISCDNRQTTYPSNTGRPEAAMTSSLTEEVIEIDLKTIMSEFAYGKDHYKAKQKYGGKLLKVKGRTSGIGEDGTLFMQVSPGNNALWCFGLPDSFLLTVNKDDIVEITGRFNRIKKGMATPCALENCFDYSKISK